MKKLFIIFILMFQCLITTYAAENPPSIELQIEKIQDVNHKKVVLFKLIQANDLKPVTLDMLKEIHTQKIHLLIVNDLLDDYIHTHPHETNVPGWYEFEWHPKQSNGNYRLWVDIFPLKTEKQEYLMTNLQNPKQPSISHHKLFKKSIINGYTFKLSFDTPTLKVGETALGQIEITDSKDNPVTDLEPVMGAFAHIVGFYKDFKTLVHLHPMGPEPSKAFDRGGPTLDFHIEPEQVGFIKLFAQVKIHGKEIFVPFGIEVK